MPELLVLTGEELPGTALRRHLIGAALRRYRQHSGYALEQAAHILECDRSKISRIETGQRGIRPRELRDLLSEYGITRREQAVLMAIADPRNARSGWWQDYADIAPAGYLDMMLLESLASEILIYDANQVPDLLQTRQYAQAAAEADPDASEPGISDRLAEMTVTRQHVISERCTKVGAVIGEGALRQLAGGTGVMREQVRWLAEVSCTHPWVTLRVLPFGGGPRPDGWSGPMAILQFADAPGHLGVVHLSGLNGGLCLTGQAEVADHVRAFIQIQTAALPPHQSARMLREMAGAGI